MANPNGYDTFKKDFNTFTHPGLIEHIKIIVNEAVLNVAQPTPREGLFVELHSQPGIPIFSTHFEAQALSFQVETYIDPLIHTYIVDHIVPKTA